MTAAHQWVRVLSGKGRGNIGYIAADCGKYVMVHLPKSEWPFDRIRKLERTIERLSETECMAMEMGRSC